MTTSTVGMTILAQMGGMSRLAVMTGSKDFVLLNDGVQFRIGRGAKANKVVIKLTASDTYDLTFYMVRGTTVKVVSNHTDVYNDSLVKTFEQATGFYLTF